ncbi:MAG: helix-turn-helix domain-containing protein [Bacteroidia bacterium]
MRKIEQYHLHKAHPEKLQFEAYPLAAYRQDNSEKAVVPHSHSYYQIIWFIKGEGVHYVDFDTYPIEDNTIIFISKDQIHAFDEKLTNEGWLIHFNESFFMQAEIDIFLKHNIFNSSLNPSYVIDHDTANTASTYIDLIQKELSNRQTFGFETVLRFLLKSLLIKLTRIHQKSPQKKLKLNSAYELQLYKFNELIETYFAKGLTIRAYADLLNISTKTLATITKKIVKKSPSQILCERIILEAKRLIKFTPLQIGEIAFRLGFEDDSYFIKYFKKQVGQSPLHYRKNVS